jgi:hypothetical protein
VVLTSGLHSHALLSRARRSLNVLATDRKRLRFPSIAIPVPAVAVVPAAVHQKHRTALIVVRWVAFDHQRRRPDHFHFGYRYGITRLYLCGAAAGRNTEHADGRQKKDLGAL